MHDIAQAAAEAAQVPDFGALARRGERRRNIRNGVTAGAAALAVATIVGLGQLIGVGDDSPPEPAPSPPTIVPDADKPPAEGPERIIDHEDAQITDAAASPDGSSVAVLWGVGNRDPHGIAVSADGWATRAVWGLPIPGDIVAADSDTFVVRDEALSKLWVVDPGGDRRLVEVAGPESPVVEGELPVAMSDGLVAVDPATATAHPVGSPEGLFRIEVYGGRLSAISTYNNGSSQVTATYHWSDDGGASWESAVFEMAWDSIEHIVPTAAGTDHAVVISTSDEPIKPLGSVLTLPADGGAFTETAYDGELATIAGAFVVDGEIRFLGDLWGTGSRPRESGIYRWTDGGLELVASSTPTATDADDTTLMDAVETPDGPTLLIAVGARLFRSTDGGVAWDELSAR